MPRQDIESMALAVRPLSGDSIRRSLRNAALFAAREKRYVTTNDCLLAIQLEGEDSSDEC